MICSVSEYMENAAADRETGRETGGEIRTEEWPEIDAETAENACAGDFIRAGLSGTATVDTIRRYGWRAVFDRLRGGSLGRDAASLARETARLFAPEVWRSLFDMIREGSVPAVKLYMELCKDTERENSHGAPYGEDGAIRELREAIFFPRCPADAHTGTDGFAHGENTEVSIGG